MVIEIPSNALVVIDLDDTLYKEIEFLRSGFRAVADRLQEEVGIDVYDELIADYEQGDRHVFQTTLLRHDVRGVSAEDLLTLYRNHPPTLALPFSSRSLLDRLRASSAAMALMTDGRSQTQRNKLRALRIEHYFSLILISEEFGSTKPARRNFVHMQDAFPERPCVCVADNPVKDFLVPNQLGWLTICLLNDGRNIHPQQAPSDAYRATYEVGDLDEIDVVASA